jgi:osmoprotectant transport system ATP-binding protein
MISIREVSKTYPAAPARGPGHEPEITSAVDRLSLEVADGEIVVLLGSSGCGKTTTLKMINRLVMPSAGEIYVDGHNTRDIDPVVLRRGIGYVFQGIGLFPHWTVADNIAATPRLLGWDEDRIRLRVGELLERVGLDPDGMRDRRPAELSGGQQQRVGVARALAAEAKLLLMDEPFGAVDPVTRDGLQQELIAMRKQLGLTILLVTHDVTEALLLADRIAVMDRGRILQIDRPSELFAHPADVIVERLLDMPRRQSLRVQDIIAGVADSQSVGESSGDVGGDS